jgi:5-methylcytosine-specific restriction protein A
MPTLPAGPCRYSHCPGRAIHRGFCVEHARRDRRERYQRNSERLYDGRWKRESRAFVAGKPCADCGEPATVTDHSKPHRGNRALFWRRDLWVARCWSCHSRKTVREDGGFGRNAKQRNALDNSLSWGRHPQK